MRHKKVICPLFFMVFCLLVPTYVFAKSQTSYPEGQKLYDAYPQSLLYYYGLTFNNPLFHVLTLNSLKRWPEEIQSIEYAYTLPEKNVIRRFFNPLVGVVQIAGNITLRNGRHEPPIYEFDPYIIFRFANWPWNHYVSTSFAIAEGVSYVTAIPTLEKKDNDDTKRLLNYLMLEATLASPRYPRLEFVIRIHHRSGAYGLYRAGNTGSNDIGLGMRYLFD